MRVLAINSMFANAMYRRCADEIGAIDGIDLTILTVDAWRMNDRPMQMDPVEAGAPYRTIVGKAGWRGYENRGFYKRGVVRALKSANPDVILLMEEPFSVFALEMLAVRRLLCPKTPVVFFTWNNLSLDIFDYRPSVFYRTAARLALPQMSAALTANSDGVTVLKDAGFRGPTEVIGYGVDTSSYTANETAASVRVELGFGESDVVIGYVGRLLYMKGIDLLLTAVSQLRADVPNVKLLLVGSGEFEEQLKAQASALGLQNILHHVAVVPHKIVPAYMQAMDILVLPSRRVGMWAEQFGRVLVEAMASGRVVVGSSSGAIPEVIGDAGLVFEENNADDLKRQLRRAIELPPAAKAELASKAKDRSANHYSWRRFAADAVGVMTSALEMKRP